MTLTNILSVALGGSIGAVLRFWLMYLINPSTKQVFPWSTLTVNLIGCFLIGIVWSLCEKYNASMSLKLLLISGGLGAFTTFSTFGFDCLKLIQQHQWVKCITYIGVSNIAGIALVALGFWVSTKLFA